MTVRIAAAKGLGTAAGEHRQKASSALSRAFGPNAGQPLVTGALVDALESIQIGLGLAIAKANLRSMDSATSRAAIEAAGQIRDKSFVSPMIDHARFLEAASREATNVGPKGRTVTGAASPGGRPGGRSRRPQAGETPRPADPQVPRVHHAPGLQDRPPSGRSGGGKRGRLHGPEVGRELQLFQPPVRLGAELAELAQDGLDVDLVLEVHLEVGLGLARGPSSSGGSGSSR